MEAGEVITVEPATLERVLPFFARLGTAKTSTSMQLETAQETCRGGVCFAVTQGGQDVAGYSLTAHDFDRGRVLWVNGAGGAAGFDLTQTIMPVIEAQARDSGAAQVAYITKRRGLIAKLEKQGYTVTGVVMRKKIT